MDRRDALFTHVCHPRPANTCIIYPHGSPADTGSISAAGYHFHHIDLYIIGKFFEMPKGAKSAPPQQSSLLDMWNKGKRKAVPKKEEEGNVKPEDDKMEVSKPGTLQLKVVGSLFSYVLS